MNGRRITKLLVALTATLPFVLPALLFTRMIEPTRGGDRIVYWAIAGLVPGGAMIVAAACLFGASATKKRFVWRVNVFGDKERPLSVDIMYEQLYTEMRRYRDHEHGVVTWWTTILLALVAGIIHFSTHGQGIHYGIRVVLVVTVVCLSSAMTCLIAYSNRRYHDLREHTNKYYDHVFQPRLRLTDMSIGGFERTLIPVWIVTIAACVLLVIAT